MYHVGYYQLFILGSVDVCVCVCVACKRKIGWSVIKLSTGTRLSEVLVYLPAELWPQLHSSDAPINSIDWIPLKIEQTDWLTMEYTINRAV